MDTPAITSGSCLCGAVRFSIGLPSKWVAHCHCSRCRRAHGAPFVTWVGARADGATIDDAAGQLRWHRAAAADGGGERGFCGRCGSPMFFRSARWPGELHVSRALFTGPLDRAPEGHVYYADHVDWVTLGDDGLPRAAESG